MDLAGVGKKPDELMRKYLAKINDDLRKEVYRNDWPLDGDDPATGLPRPKRRPTTWEEIADCCDMELETRLEIAAPKDLVHTLTFKVLYFLIK